MLSSLSLMAMNHTVRSISSNSTAKRGLSILILPNNPTLPNPRLQNPNKVVLRTLLWYKTVYPNLHQSHLVKNPGTYKPIQSPRLPVFAVIRALFWGSSPRLGFFTSLLSLFGKMYMHWFNPSSYPQIAPAPRHLPHRSACFSALLRDLGHFGKRRLPPGMFAWILSTPNLLTGSCDIQEAHRIAEAAQDGGSTSGVCRSRTWKSMWKPCCRTSARPVRSFEEHAYHELRWLHHSMLASCSPLTVRVGPSLPQKNSVRLDETGSWTGWSGCLGLAWLVGRSALVLPRSKGRA